MNTPTPNFDSYSSIQTLWIDVDQTLLDFDACAQIALEQTFEQYGLPWSQEVFQVFLRINALLWNQIEEGTLTRMELRKIRFPRIFEALKRELPDPVGFEAQFSSILHQQAVPMPGALEAIPALKQAGYRLAIISNGPEEGQKNRLNNAGLLEYFDTVYTSQKLGAAKPSQAFFDRAFQDYQSSFCPNLKQEEILVIGDSWKADIQGAIDFGCRGLWLSANRQLDPFETENHPDVREVGSWNEILELLIQQRDN